MNRLAGSIVLLSGGKRTLAAMLAGAFAVLTQAPTDFILAGFISFPILVWLLDGAAPAPSAGALGRLKPAFHVGWWFGFGYFLAGLWWIGGAFVVEDLTYAWALPFAIFGLPIYLSIYFGFAAALARIFWTDGVGRLAALAFAFALAEWLRETLLTGFPWNPIGFGLMPVPLLMQSVGVVGVVGINALAVFVFAVPALLAGRKHRVVGICAAIALLAGHVGYGLYSMSQEQPSSETLQVRIVQPNIELTEKWDESVRDQIFNSELALSKQAPAVGQQKPQLIVWPETSIPFLFQEQPDGLPRIGDMLDEGQTLLAGVARTEGGGDSRLYYNSVVSINDKGEIADAVDKVHLVPFGEYIPFESIFELIGVNQLVSGPMNFVAGANRHPIAVPGGFSALPYICYEIIFPGLMINPAPAKSFILNVTNDAWFGNTPGPYQHLRQAQIRAVETGLPVVRAANTGISAFIDEKGRVLDALAIKSQGILDANLRIPASSQMDSGLQNRIGAGIAFIFALVAAILALLRKIKN